MMEKKAFNEWCKRFAKTITDSDKLVYQDTIYTPQDLFNLYSGLKVTEADIRGYDSFFTIELRGTEYFTLQQVIDYVATEIIDTAVVITVRHKEYLKGRDIHLHNEAYQGGGNQNSDFVLGKKNGKLGRRCTFTRVEANGTIINCKKEGCVRCNGAKST